MYYLTTSMVFLMTLVQMGFHGSLLNDYLYESFVYVLGLF